MFSIASLAMVALAACDEVPGLNGYSIVEITDATTNDPVVDAEVTYLVISRDEERERGRVAPTDEQGRTLLYLSNHTLAVPLSDFNITVRHADRTETLRVLNQPGAMVVGEQFAIEVIDNAADPPEPPLLQPVEGSSPVVIIVESLISTVGVCSNETGLIHWKVSPNRGPVYLDSVEVGVVPVLDSAEVGVVPDPLDDTTLYGHNGMLFRPFCRVPISSCECPGEGFTIFAKAPHTNDYFGGVGYCLDDAERATPCLEP